MIYLLFYGTDTGASEDWQVFYTPAEVFRTKEERDARIKFLENVQLGACSGENSSYYEFETRDLEFTERADAPHMFGDECEDGNGDVEQEWTDEINRW